MGWNTPHGCENDPNYPGNESKYVQCENPDCRVLGYPDELIWDNFRKLWVCEQCFNDEYGNDKYEENE